MDAYLLKCINQEFKNEEIPLKIITYRNISKNKIEKKFALKIEYEKSIYYILVDLYKKSGFKEIIREIKTYMVEVYIANSTTWFQDRYYLLIIKSLFAKNKIEQDEDCGEGMKYFEEKILAIIEKYKNENNIKNENSETNSKLIKSIMQRATYDEYINYKQEVRN